MLNYWVLFIAFRLACSAHATLNLELNQGVTAAIPVKIEVVATNGEHTNNLEDLQSITS